MRGDSHLKITIAETSHPLFVNNIVFTQGRKFVVGRVYKLDGFRSSLHGISSLFYKVSGLFH